MHYLLRKALQVTQAVVYRNLWAVPYPWLVRLATPRHDSKLKHLFDRTGIALVHIPKTAGTSVETVLYEHSIKHRPWFELQQLDPEGFTRWHKVAVVRDPIDRFLSAYDYLSRGGRNQLDREFRRRFVADTHINCFVQRLQSQAFRAQVTQWFHLRPQADYVVAPDGVIMVDQLIAFERLKTDVEKLAGATGRSLPQLNVTPGQRTPREQLSPLALDILAEVYERDYALHKTALSASNGIFGQTLGSRKG